MGSRRDPYDYQVTVVRPPDFDEFWRQVMADLTALPLAPSVTPVPERSSPDVDVFRIHYTSLDGLRISGWYCLPADRPEPLPALLLPPGYISDPTIPKSWAREGYAALALAPRGKIGSNALYDPGFPGLLIHHLTDRDSYAYRGLYADAARAVDFVQSRPEVDANRVGIYGSSQGGALAVTTAALRPDAIVCAVSGVPYLCAFRDSVRLTRSYPYEEINEYLRLHPERREQVFETLDYFDVINFAQWVRAPTHVYVGMEDDVCPPETGLALYEALPGEKALDPLVDCAHTAGYGRSQRPVRKFLAQHLWPRPSGLKEQPA